MAYFVAVPYVLRITRGRGPSEAAAVGCVRLSGGTARFIVASVPA
jgi:hypothetical protein